MGQFGDGVLLSLVVRLSNVPLLTGSRCVQIHKFDDAYTMLMKGLLRKLCNRGMLTVKRCGKRWFAPMHNGVVQV